MTTSALSPFRRQYSCACSTCRTSGSASSSPTRDEQDRADRRRCRAARAPPGRARSAPAASGLARSDPSAIEHPRREPLEQQRLVARDAEVAQRALRVREREREGAGRRARVAVLLRERHGRLAIRRDARGEREPHGPARREPDPLAQADDRIERRRRWCRTARARRAPAGRRCRGRGRGSGRDRSPIRPAPCGRPSRLSTCTAQTSAPGRIRRAAAGRAAPRSRADIPFRGTACRTPDARGRRPAAASTISA